MGTMLRLTIDLPPAKPESATPASTGRGLQDPLAVEEEKPPGFVLAREPRGATFFAVNTAGTIPPTCLGCARGWAGES